jgi:hypothetical protein
MLKIITLGIILIFHVKFNESCFFPWPPEPSTTTSVPEPPFNYSNQLINGKFELLYNDIVLILPDYSTTGEIRGRIKASSNCRVVGLGVYEGYSLKTALTHDGTEPRVTGDGFRFIRFIKSRNYYFIDFDFVLCKSSNNNFGYFNMKFLPICAENSLIHENVFPSFSKPQPISDKIFNYISC